MRSSMGEPPTADRTDIGPTGPAAPIRWRRVRRVLPSKPIVTRLERRTVPRGLDAPPQRRRKAQRRHSVRVALHARVIHPRLFAETAPTLSDEFHRTAIECRRQPGRLDWRVLVDARHGRARHRCPYRLWPSAPPG